MKRLKFAVILLASLFACGCAFYRSGPVEVYVIDAETQSPVANAQIRLDYIYMLVLNAPRPTDATSDEHGHAVINASNFKQQVWQVSAPGYISLAEWRLHDWEVKTFDLYRVPDPSVTIVLPAGYRGPLKVVLHGTDDLVQDEVGKRDFTYAATSSGLVEIDATPLLMRWRAYEITAIYEDGQVIPRADYRVADTEVALRYVTVDSNRALFVVGSAADAQAIHSIVYRVIDDDPYVIALDYDAFAALFEEDSSSD